MAKDREAMDDDPFQDLDTRKVVCFTSGELIDAQGIGEKLKTILSDRFPEDIEG